MPDRRDDFSLDDEGGAWADVGQPSKGDKSKNVKGRIVDALKRKGNKRDA
jgi:hypothetical protein